MIICYSCVFHVVFYFHLTLSLRLKENYSQIPITLTRFYHFNSKKLFLPIATSLTYFHRYYSCFSLRSFDPIV